MKDITQTIGTLYNPVKAFVVYQKDTAEKSIYLEAYDMDKKGCPINAHPLSLRESTQLAGALDTSEELTRKFLKPSGLLPKKVLYLNPEQSGFAIWYTPAQKVDLFFAEGLGIENGKAFVPPLLWKASKNTLYIYAIDTEVEINEQTALYHAPFFNLYSDGKVCMGTVKVDIKADCHLENFMQSWEQYFFNSYFSHLIIEKSPVKTNIVQLWQNLVNTRKCFPLKSLLKNGLTIRNLLS
ncbi:PRTRC system protein B [Flavobacterium aquidurense]|uniref:PRTRC system protein B n=1 Tax=Flavobacterium aquidurense TaxID=362413 RepID=UPI000917A2F8|nr:PRTRC system protein B [Flavobacterium aquidurense]OXA71221.1 PRTRC system protein B [Flavobacterium aquidurense]SHG68791.1 PRTRC system protein B [Flavobacterium frigidimaris]